VVWILQFYERLWNLLPILKPFLFLIKWYLKRELHTKIRSNFGKKKTDANSQTFFLDHKIFTAVSSFPTNAYVWLLAWITNYTNSCLCVFYTGKIKSWCPTLISSKFFLHVESAAGLPISIIHTFLRSCLTIVTIVKWASSFNRDLG